MTRKAASLPPAVVLCGDEAYQKSQCLTATLEEVLGPADRAMAVSEYDAAAGPDSGGPTAAAVLDDLATLPFLAPVRIVIVHNADKFISSAREALEKYMASPAATSCLILLARTFPKTTRLYKAVLAAGGRIVECKKLSAGQLADFVEQQARERGKRFAPGLAERLIDRIGFEQSLLVNEVEKLALYAGQRAEITLADLDALVSQTREEKIFAVLDQAAAGNLPATLAQWQQVLDNDRSAPFKAVGGIAFRLRQWLGAQRLKAQGLPDTAIAQRVMMWGRDRELAGLLRRLPPAEIARLLADLAQLDSQAKVGARTIEMGVDALLTRIAGAN